MEALDFPASPRCASKLKVLETDVSRAANEATRPSSWERIFGEAREPSPSSQTESLRRNGSLQPGLGTWREPFSSVESAL